MAIRFDAAFRRRLTEQVMRRSEGRTPPDDETLRKIILMTVAGECSGTRIALNERQEIAQRLFQAMRGFDLLQPLMDDPRVTEIMVNGPAQIYCEREGRLEQTDLRFDDEAHLLGVIANFFGRANRLLHEKQPLGDMRLPDGSRVHAVLPPVALNGAVLTIRKFTGMRPDMDYLLECGFLTQAAADFLAEAVRSRQTVFICGGTGTGKTTFLNILSTYIPPDERVITIEDAAELHLQGQPNLVRLEARAAGPDGTGEISLMDLIRTSLRMRPDRIIVGEVRGREAFDMLQAMNTGHPGSLCTGHANSCSDMISRLSLMVLMAAQLPWDAIRGLIGSAIQVLVHLTRRSDGRRQISEICTVRAIGSDIRLEPQYCCQTESPGDPR